MQVISLLSLQGQFFSLLSICAIIFLQDENMSCEVVSCYFTCYQKISRNEQEDKPGTIDV